MTQLSVQLGGGSPITPLSGESYSGAAGAMGLLTTASLGAMTGGTGAYTATYDALGRLTSGLYTYTPIGLTAQTLYRIQPTYDALSNVIEAVTTLPQGTDTQVFCSDDRSRLTWAGSAGTPACSGAPSPSDTGSLVGTGAQYSAALGASSDVFQRPPACGPPMACLDYDYLRLPRITSATDTMACTPDRTPAAAHPPRYRSRSPPAGSPPASRQTSRRRDRR
ncbi:MAG TPA: hypothetical protein VF808_18970, partial [Ktedonobacterales bacterium]